MITDTPFFRDKNRSIDKIKILILCIFIAFYYSSAQSVRVGKVEAELISENLTVKPGSKFLVGVVLKMDTDWHTYWLNPGDAGLETKITWQLPEGISHSDILWPAPKKIYLGDLANYGYEGKVLLPVEISVPDSFSAETLKLNAVVDWLVCKVECLPGRASLTLDREVRNIEPQSDLRHLEIFQKTRFDQPLTIPDWQFSLTANDNQYLLTAKAPDELLRNLTGAEFYPFENGVFHNAADQNFTRMESGFSLNLRLDPFAVSKPDTLRGILISSDGWRGAGSEKALLIEVPLTTETGDSEPSLLLVILFSFIGGILLNIMPCVLPVLSIKILGIIEHSGKNSNDLLRHGLSYTIGVVFAFLALAAIMLILKAGGAELGWGFQLQSPEFVISLTIFLLIFSLNLFGLFDLGSSFSAAGARMEKPGGKNLSGFLSGIAATLLATPCTAPFMGTAVGFSISQPPLITLVVFLFLGLGMAFPYLLIVNFPAAVKVLPKPGSLILRFKEFMGFLLLGTILWLLWVLSFQVDSSLLIILLSAFLIASFGTWIYGFLQKPYNSRIIRFSGLFLFLLILFFALYLPLSSIKANENSLAISGSRNDNIQWQKYSPEIIQKFESDGERYFLDFTAAWCLTCQVNEKVALENAEIADLFRKYGITPVKADWTNRDEAITRELGRFKRNSVPLYVLFTGTEHILLPEIITSSIVSENIKNLIINK